MDVIARVWEAVPMGHRMRSCVASQSDAGVECRCIQTGKAERSTEWPPTPSCGVLFTFLE